MDVAFAAVLNALASSGIQRVVLSYNIACKFSTNFRDRVLFKDGPLLDTDALEGLDIVWVVNQWHLAGHQESCADEFGLRYKDNVGRFSGEAVETPWAQLDKLQYITRVMTWGNRRDVLTAVVNHWNWQKTLRIGTQFSSFNWEHLYTDCLEKYQPNLLGKHTLLLPWRLFKLKTGSGNSLGTSRKRPLLSWKMSPSLLMEECTGQALRTSQVGTSQLLNPPVC